MPHRTTPARVVACTENSLRLPMAEAMMKHLHGHHVFVDLVGARPAR
jgi:protein-tyrosine-phosphatase